MVLVEKRHRTFCEMTSKIMFHLYVWVLVVGFFGGCFFSTFVLVTGPKNHRGSCKELTYLRPKHQLVTPNGANCHGIQNPPPKKYQTQEFTMFCPDLGLPSEVV